MEGGLLFLILVSMASLAVAHYEGYPFVHANDGRYGAQYRVANYKEGAAEAAPEHKAPSVRPVLAGRVADGKRFGFLPNADGNKLEFGYRKQSGFPVHLGNGNFYFLGDFSKVSCKDKSGDGLYFTGDRTSYTVCENGRSHKFACPKGTRNKDATYFRFNERYDRSDLCSEHDETA